jgi:hypothetical protein
MLALDYLTKAAVPAGRLQQQMHGASGRGSRKLSHLGERLLSLWANLATPDLAWEVQTVATINLDHRVKSRGVR